MSDAPTDKPRRRLFDRVAGSPTLIGAGTHFEGRLTTDGPLTVNGSVVGDGIVNGALAIAADGRWQGNVQAASGVIVGSVRGDLSIAGKLEIGRQAVIHGSVRALSVAIADGAIVDGELTVTGSEPVLRFAEKRSRPAGD